MTNQSKTTTRQEEKVLIRKNATSQALQILQSFFGMRSFVPPINSIAIATSLGYGCKEGPGVETSGIILTSSTGQRYLIINETLSRIESRLTLARLLGTAIYEDNDRTSNEISQKDKKHWVNCFAQELLMPQGAVRALYVNGQLPHEIARRFHVTETMIYEVLSRVA